MAIKASKAAQPQEQAAAPYQITPSSRGAGRAEGANGRCVSCGGSKVVSGMFDGGTRACPFC